MSEWRLIESFPGYSVSDDGQVRNEKTERILSLLVNQCGVVSVSLMRDHIQYKRSVSILVAEAFLEDKPQPSFVSPINLDGDRSNNTVENLRWRPRWFAVKYFRQFKSGRISCRRRIEDIDTHQEFNSSWDAATKFGLLDAEILIAMRHNIYVWPTFQRFRIIR